MLGALMTWVTLRLKVQGAEREGSLRREALRVTTAPPMQAA
jgi:hypothetical protein